MSDTAVQTNRLLSIETPLGPDILLMDAYRGTESMSRLFQFEVDLLAELSNESKVKADQLLGKPVTIKTQIGTADADSSGAPPKYRYFHGIISRFSSGGRDGDFAYYQASIVPWAWLLTQKSDCRVFQNLTVPEIVEKIFKKLQGDFSFVSFDKSLQRQYTKLDYVVQYRETDFNFISRLLEEEGIFYYFIHTEKEHKLMMADSGDVHQPAPHHARIRYTPEGGEGEHGEDVIFSWKSDQSLHTGKHTVRDYHFQMPSTLLEASKPAKKKVGGSDKLEMFDYPGRYAHRFNKPDERMGQVEPEGPKFIDTRVREEELDDVVAYGGSGCSGLTPGFKFEFNADDETTPPAHRKGEYLITSVNHSAVQWPDYRSVEETESSPYRNAFSCIPASVPFSPARVTPKPVVEGLQSAVVVGPSGEEIHTDKYGRVKVQFHWDREGKKDENSSCWVRVGQAAAGTQWGSFFWPRIGHEVLVAFLEGDPDQPIIVGSVYNYNNMPPYDLKDHKTRSGIKTRSTLKGNDKTFNEIRFEDKKDSEEIYLHAEKDLNTVIENNETRKIGFDKKDKGDQTIEVYNNRTIKVGKAGCADGSQNLTVYKDRTAKIEMGNDSLTIKMGNQTTKLDLGKSETEAMQSIELKVGQSSIKLDQAGITMEGMMLKLNGTVMTQVKGLMTQVNADAILTVKGSLTMIN